MLPVFSCFSRSWPSVCMKWSFVPKCAAQLPKPPTWEFILKHESHESCRLTTKSKHIWRIRSSASLKYWQMNSWNWSAFEIKASSFSIMSGSSRPPPRTSSARGWAHGPASDHLWQHVCANQKQVWFGLVRNPAELVSNCMWKVASWKPELPLNNALISCGAQQFSWLKLGLAALLRR